MVGFGRCPERRLHKRERESEVLESNLLTPHAPVTRVKPSKSVFSLKLEWGSQASLSYKGPMEPASQGNTACFFVKKQALVASRDQRKPSLPGFQRNFIEEGKNPLPNLSCLVFSKTRLSLTQGLTSADSTNVPPRKPTSVASL